MANNESDIPGQFVVMGQFIAFRYNSESDWTLASSSVDSFGNMKLKRIRTFETYSAVETYVEEYYKNAE